MIDFITFCDYSGTFAFAISGIRLASAKKFDWFGAYVVGGVTAVGGGTLRDVLLNVTPFWMTQASYLVISGLALLFVLLFRKYVIRLNNTFFILPNILFKTNCNYLCSIYLADTVTAPARTHPSSVTLLAVAAGRMPMALS